MGRAEIGIEKYNWVNKFGYCDRTSTMKDRNRMKVSTLNLNTIYVRCMQRTLPTPHRGYQRTMSETWNFLKLLFVEIVEMKCCCFEFILIQCSCCNEQREQISFCDIFIHCRGYRTAKNGMWNETKFFSWRIFTSEFWIWFSFSKKSLTVEHATKHQQPILMNSETF